MDLLIYPSKLKGNVSVPPSKSIAHRAYILDVLSKNPTKIVCPSDCEDLKATRECLKSLKEFGCCDCRESGSTLRFLLPLATVLVSNVDKTIRFTGSKALAKRPLSPLIEELRRHGAQISDAGSFPITVSGHLSGGRYHIPSDQSSQFISGLLMALPLLSEDSEIILTTDLSSASYVSQTIEMLSLFGIQIKKTENGFCIPGGQEYRSPGTILVEADWSSAAFWLVAGIFSDKLCLQGMNQASIQGDRQILSVLKEFGVEINVSPLGISVQRNASKGLLSPPLESKNQKDNFPRSNQRKDGINKTTNRTIDAKDIPDLIPILSLLSAYTKGTTTFLHTNRLRSKESDRVEAILSLLKALDIKAQAGDDSITIYGTEKPQKKPTPSIDENAKKTEPIEIDSYNDHRIAMTAAVAATIINQPILLHQAECVNKSYPDFFSHYQALGGHFLKG